MRPRPARLAAVALLLATPALPLACGEGETVTAGKPANPARAENRAAPAAERQGSPAAERRTAAPPRPRHCRVRLRGFVRSLEELRGSLVAGMTYRDYLADVRALRRVYDRIPARRLPLGCLVAVATPGERALNGYIDGANVWGDCLAVASCRPHSVEAELRRIWRRAARLTAYARRAM